MLIVPAIHLRKDTPSFWFQNPSDIQQLYPTISGKFLSAFCVTCSGIDDMGNIAGNGTYEHKRTKSSLRSDFLEYIKLYLIYYEKVRKFICRTCGKSFNSRSGTVFYDLMTNKDTFILALKMVLSDIHLRKISYILDVKLDTIRDCLLRAANHSEKVNDIFLKELHISKVELDELWTFVKKTNSGSGRP